MQLSRVDFPQPECPMKHTNCHLVQGLFIKIGVHRRMEPTDQLVRTHGEADLHDLLTESQRERRVAGCSQ